MSLSFSDFIYPFLHGTLTTILLTVGSSLFGLVLMIFILLGCFCRFFLVRFLARSYIFFFRGTPLLAQMYLIYYGSGQFKDFLSDIYVWPLLRQAWFCALLSLALNTAAYMAEITRAAYVQFPREEIEAAHACGLNKRQTLRYILIPRLIGMAFPIYTNEIVYQLQATSLVSMISLLDITGQARLLASRTFLIYQTFFMAAILYISLVLVITWASRRLEKRLLKFKWSST